MGVVEDFRVGDLGIGDLGVADLTIFTPPLRLESSLTLTHSFTHN